MSGIKGSKSKFYIKEPLPGIENSSDTLVNVTTGELPGARIGLDVIQHGVYEVNNAGIIGAGSAQRIIECINHGANAGDVMKITSGNSLDAEIAIIGVIDADNFVIAYEENLSVGDTFSVLRYVSAKYSQDGSLQVSSGPIQFTKNGSAELVVEDTVTPANNEALPSKMFIVRDGVQLPVTKDTGTPSNNVAVPVELVGAAGPINITAGDLNVQLTDQGPNADVTRIGNGTNQWNINASGEGLVHDADVLAELQTINTNTSGLATEVTLDAVKTAVELVDDTIAIDGGAALTKFQTVGGHTGTTSHAWHVDSSGNGRVDVRSSVLPTGAATETTIATLATEATALNTYNEIVTLGNEANTNALTQIQQLGAINETAPATDTASSGLNGRLQRIAQRLTSLIALLPSSIGQKVKTDSLSVTLASDQGALSVTPTNNSGTITNAQVTVGVTSVRATVSGSAPNASRKKLVIKPSKNNSGAIYLGSSSVTTANGLEIIGPDRLEFELDASDYYLISDTAAQVVEVLEVV